MRTSQSMGIGHLRFLLVAILSAGFVMFGMTTPAAASTTHTVTVTLSGTTCDANTIVTTSAGSLQVATGDSIRVTVTNNVNNGAPVTCGIALTRDPFGGLLTGWGDAVTTPPTDLSASNGTGIFFNVNNDPRLLGGPLVAGTVPTVVRLGTGLGSLLPVIVTTIQIVEPSAAGTNSTPPDLIQQFAVDPDNDCRSVPSSIEVFNTPRDGGWSKSWAQWPNEGTGGFVCTRQVMYQSATLTWVPRTSS